MSLTPLGLFRAASGLTLLVLGFLALTARKSRASRHAGVGEAYFWTLLVVRGSAMLVGARNPGPTLFEIMTPPTLALGILGYVMAKRRPKGWLSWHIIGQGGSYIGVVTAFGFQVFPRVLPESVVLTVAYWLLPTLLGTALINRTVAKWVTRRARNRQVATT